MKKIEQKLMKHIFHNYFKKNKPQIFFTSHIMQDLGINFETAKNTLQELARKGILIVSFDLICPESGCDEEVKNNLTQEEALELINKKEPFVCETGQSFIPQQDDFLFHFHASKTFFTDLDKKNPSLYG